MWYQVFFVQGLKIIQNPRDLEADVFASEGPNNGSISLSACWFPIHTDPIYAQQSFFFQGFTEIGVALV